MQCPTIEKLAEYQAGALTVTEGERLGVHIVACERCRRELDALAQTARLVEALPVPAMPDTLWNGVAARIEAHPRRVPHFWWRWAAGFGVTAALLLGVMVTRLQTPELPVASTASSSYVTQHELLSARDSLADRAGLGVMLASNRSDE